MTLKPNYLRGFILMASWIFGVITVVSGVVPYLRSEHVAWSSVLSSALIGSALLSLGVCVIFTPREITWDEEGITSQVIFPKSGEYSWRQLEAYSTWGRQVLHF